MVDKKELKTVEIIFTVLLILFFVWWLVYMFHFEEIPNEIFGDNIALILYIAAYTILNFPFILMIITTVIAGIADYYRKKLSKNIKQQQQEQQQVIVQI